MVKIFNLRLWRGLLGVLLILILTTGCQVDHSPLTTQTTTKVRDEIVVALAVEDFDEKGFDPTLGWNYSGPPLFQSTLLYRNENLDLTNDLAESYTVSSDRKVWTFKIRQDVRFSDGQPLTAEDVAYTFNQTKQSGGLVDLTVLNQAIATSNYSVELHLQHPQITFVNQIVSLGIVPKHAHNKNYFRNPIGSGPYRLLQWNPGEQLIVEANPNYYREPPAIKRLVFLLSEEDASLAAAKAGRAQVARVLPTLAFQQIPGMKLSTYRTDAHAGLIFPYVANTGKKTPQGDPIGNNVTADIAIRQAVNYAINRQVLVNAILSGYGSPAYTLTTGLPWDEPDAVIKEANPNKAQQILMAAGWRDDNGDRILERKGIKAEFSLLYPAQDITRQGLALAVAQMLKPIGIQVNVEGKTWKEIASRMHSNVVLYILSTYNPLILYNLYHSSPGRGDWENPGYYANSVTDQKLEEGMLAASEPEAALFWKKVQWDGQTGLSTLGDAASAWLVNLDQTYFVNTCLDLGRPQTATDKYSGSILTNVTSWKWICR